MSEGMSFGPWLLPATVVVVALVVVALVVYLTGTLITLVRAGTRLAKIAGGLQAIVEHTDPLEDRLGTVNLALGQLEEGLRGIDGRLVGIAHVFRL